MLSNINRALKVLLSVNLSKIYPTTSSIYPRASPSCLTQFCQLTTTAGISTRLKMSEKKAFERLPLDVVPSNYALRLIPDLQKFTFEGHEDISVQVIQHIWVLLYELLISFIF